MRDTKKEFAFKNELSSNARYASAARNYVEGTSRPGALMTMPDLLCVALIVLAPLIDYFLVWRGFLRRSQVNPARARIWFYSIEVVELWILVACVVVLWLEKGRPWTGLRLTAPSGWRLWTSASLVAAVAIALASSIIKIARPKRKRRIKVPGDVARRAPHTRSELAWWVALSISAGFCEELVFRGYLIWVFQPLLGMWAAAALSVVVFALGHGYEGAKNVVMTGIVGCALTVIVILFGSLWPAIAIHALVDLQQGLVAWLVLRVGRDGEAVTILPRDNSPVL
jgi:hypothetical protein